MSLAALHPVVTQVVIVPSRDALAPMHLGVTRLVVTRLATYTATRAVMLNGVNRGRANRRMMQRPSLSPPTRRRA